MTFLLSTLLARIFVNAERKRISEGLAPEQIVVAARDLSPGRPLSPDSIRLRPVPRTFVHGNAIYPEEREWVLGRALAVPVRAGDPILWQDFPREETAAADDRQAADEGAPVEQAAGPSVDPEKGPAGPRTVFITKSPYRGDLGGLEGADALCQKEADAAGLAGLFRAWLSDLSTSPASRFTRSPRAYRLVKDHTVAADWSELTDGAIGHAINRTAAGALTKARPVWTNTSPDGTPVNKKADPREDACGGWSSQERGTFGVTGSSLDTGSGWTDAGLALSCNVPAALYCFQQ